MEFQQIVYCSQMFLAGMNFYGDPFAVRGEWSEENEIGYLWARFMKYFFQNQTFLQPHMVKNGFYEMHWGEEEAQRSGKYDIFVGFPAQNIDQLPHSLLIRSLPAVDYAVFRLQGEEIVSDWTRTILHEWMPTNGKKWIHHYLLQYYDDRFKGMDRLAESELDVYFPVTDL